VRFDPEDYAFVAHYDNHRVLSEVVSLGKQSTQRLIFMGVAVIMLLIIWFVAGRPSPSQWAAVTGRTAICLAAVLLVAVIAMIVSKVTAQNCDVSGHAAVLCLLMIASAGLIIPILMIRSELTGYTAQLQTFIDGLSDKSSGAGVQRLVSDLNITRIVLMALAVLGWLIVIVGVGCLASWVTEPRSLGWVQRKVISIALWVAAISLIACCAGVLALTKYIVPRVETSLNSVNPAGGTVTLPALAAGNDWLIWLLLAGFVVSVATFMAGTARLTNAALLLARLPVGNALRVDPLGMVVDDPLGGPQRVTWADVYLITARARQSLPGPELVIGRAGHTDWSVPFMFLDVLPGTIDSAIRAHTMDAWELDLNPLDKIV